MNGRVVTLLLAWLSVVLVPLAAQGQEQAPAIAFSAAHVEQLAAEMAKKPFVPPSAKLPEEWLNLGYDRYRDVRFRAERAIWRGQGRNFELHLLPSGWLFKQPVDIYVVDGGRAERVTSANCFEEVL